jgi:hypothetical protein
MDDQSFDQSQVLTAFGDAPPSRLSSHQSTCCTFAREALIGQFASMPDIASALSRIPERLPWGDTSWPSYWCDVAQASAGDSGVHAELAGAVMDRFGIQRRRGKAVLSSPPSVVMHWRHSWRAEGSAISWIVPPNLVYREVLRVARRWWDPTDCCWIGNVGESTPVGTVIALAEDGCEWVVVPSRRQLR